MLSIRKANVNDIQSIQSICKESWKTTYKNIYPSQYIEQVFSIFYNKERLIKDLTECSLEWNGYWLAEENGRPLGCIGGGMSEDHKANIYVLYVLPQFQRKGIGHALVQTLTAYQKESSQAKQQAVTVTEGNQNAISFYEKEGFVFELAQENWIDSSQAKDFCYIRNI